MDTRPVRAIVADDHPMCRDAARIALEAVGPASVTEAATLAELLADRGDADCILLDLGLPDSRGVASLIDVVRERPRTPVLVVSGAEGDVEARVRAAGAAGFVSKMAPLTDLIAAVRAVVSGEQWFSASSEQVTTPDGDAAQRLGSLSPAEARVLRAMGDGSLNKQIAYDLGLSEITVKQHVTAILRKLDVGNRTQAVLLRQRVADGGSDPKV